MHEAKSKLSALAEKVWQGEEVIIAKANKPYLILKPYQPKHPNRVPGHYKDQIVIGPDFDETPPEVLASFEESKI